MISQSLCTSTAAKEILDLVLSSNLKIYIFQHKCSEHSELKTEQVTGPQQKPFQAFEKLLHSFQIIYRNLYHLLLFINFFSILYCITWINSVYYSSQRGAKSHPKKQSYIKSQFLPEMTLLKSQQNFQTHLKSNLLFTPISNIYFKRFSRWLESALISIYWY